MSGSNLNYNIVYLVICQECYIRKAVLYYKRFKRSFFSRPSSLLSICHNAGFWHEFQRGPLPPNKIFHGLCFHPDLYPMASFPGVCNSLPGVTLSQLAMSAPHRPFFSVEQGEAAIHAPRASDYSNYSANAKLSLILHPSFIIRALMVMLTPCGILRCRVISRRSFKTALTESMLI